MQKYGFVYIWFDKKRKKYYVGSHWGTEDDGYICSSRIMRNVYKRRPNTFKRKILSRFESKIEMYISENYYLSQIKNEELGKRFYNLRNCHFNHWAVDEKESMKIKKTISERTKEAMTNPEIRKKYLEAINNRNTRSSDPMVREKRSKSMIGKNVGKVQWKAINAAADANRGKKLTKEHKIKIASAGVFKKLNSSKKICPNCGFIGNPGNIGRYHGDKCKKVKG